MLYDAWAKPSVEQLVTGIVGRHLVFEGGENAWLPSGTFDKVIKDFGERLKEIDKAEMYKEVDPATRLTLLLSQDAHMTFAPMTKDDATWYMGVPLGDSLRSFIQKKGLSASAYGAANVDELFATTVEYAANPANRKYVNKTLKNLLVRVFSGQLGESVSDYRKKIMGEAVSNVEDEVRAKLAAGEMKGVHYRSIFRSYGGTQAVVEIMGMKFTIDDSTRLTKQAKMVQVGGRGLSVLPGRKTGKDLNDYFNSFPKLGLKDFAMKVKD